jgi:hypothetical protein
MDWPWPTIRESVRSRPAAAFDLSAIQCAALADRAHNDARRRRTFQQIPAPRVPTAAMNLDAQSCAGVEFRDKLNRGTGVNLPVADCVKLLGLKFSCKDGEKVTLQSNPGSFYACLGVSIEGQRFASEPLVIPSHEKIAWWCFREAAEVYQHAEGMHRL